MMFRPASGDASPRMSVQSHSEFFMVRHPKLNATQPTRDTLTPRALSYSASRSNCRSHRVHVGGFTMRVVQRTPHSIVVACLSILFVGCERQTEAPVPAAVQQAVASATPELSQEECYQELLDIDRAFQADIANNRTTTECSSDSECELVPLELSCHASCPVAVSSQFKSAYRSQLSSLERRFCGRRRPCVLSAICTPVVARCAANRCVAQAVGLGPSGPASPPPVQQPLKGGG